MPVTAADPATLVDAAQRAAAMLLHHAEQLDKCARQAASELHDGHPKAARASASASVGALDELARIAPATTRLLRGAVRALDDEMTRHGGLVVIDGAPIVERRRGDRRMGDRRAPFAGRRRDDFDPAA